MIILTIRLYWVQWNVIKIDGDQAPPRLPHWSIISSSRHPSRFHSCNLYICPEGGSRLQSISNFKTQIIGIWKMGWPPKLLVMYKQYSKGKAPPTLVNCPRRWSLFFIFVFLCWSSTNKYQKYKSVGLGDQLVVNPSGQPDRFFRVFFPYHKNTFFLQKSIKSNPPSISLGLVWRNPKGFLISTK